MNIQHLIYALEVYHCGSIGKAAQNLFVAQPNLSKAIRELEEEINTTIFIRTSRGVTVTKEGIEFLQQAQGIAVRFHMLEQRYVRPRTKATKNVSLSITSMRSSVVFSKFCRFINEKLQQEYTVKVFYREGNNEDALNDLVSNRSDISIIRTNEANFDYYKQLIESKHFLMAPLPSDCYRVLMSRNHPLAGEKYIMQEMLEPYLEILYDDFETPWYPHLSEAQNPDSVGSSEKKVLHIYDRGTLMDALSLIEGAYTWTTTISNSAMASYNLVEKYCNGLMLEGKEFVVYRPALVGRKHLQDVIACLSGYE